MTKSKGPWLIGSKIDSTPVGDLVNLTHGTSQSKAIGLLVAATPQKDIPPLLQHTPKTLSLAQLVDTISGEGETLLAFEGVTGNSFQKVAEHRLLPFETALSVGVQICEALRELHAQGIIHGAPYYEHLIASGEDTVRLLGQGLSGLLAAPCSTELKYLDPLILPSGIRSPSSDLYATGIVLYRLATGQFPFSPESVAEVQNRALTLPPAIGKRSSNWPIAGFDILNRATSLNPAHRFATATEFRNALAKLSGRKIIEIREPTSVSMAIPPPPSPPSRFWIGALILLAGLTAWSFVR